MTTPAYPHTQLLIDGQWCDAAARRLEQLVAERLLELAHLGTDGLHRHL